MSGQTITFKEFSSLYRYTGTFNDPNNAAVIFVAIMATLILNNHLGFQKEIIIIFFVALIVISTMSSTGIIAFSLIFVLYLVKKTRQLNTVKSTKNIFLLIFVVASIFVFAQESYIINSEVLDTAIQRTSNNSADSRIAKWDILLENFRISYIIIGNGGTIFINNIEASAHNGHIYLIYSYGLIPYLIFMYIFFRKRKHTTKMEYLSISPLFLGFSVNVGIYDLRFAIIFSLLIAMQFNKIRGKYKI